MSNKVRKYKDFEIDEQVVNWTIIGIPERKSHGEYEVTCRCVCGNIEKVELMLLRTGWSTSCGCIKEQQHKCIDCGCVMPNSAVINGKRRDIRGRTFCLVCKPIFRKSYPKSLPIGNVYGLLTVIDRERPISKRPSVWCKCDCGTYKIIAIHELLNGHTGSCGCLKHRPAEGLYGTPEHNAWRGMHTRCESSRPDYGGRGIKVHPEWFGKDGFQKFLNHVGKKPSEKHSLDRIDVNGNYEPGNVRWATQKEQIANQRKRLRIEQYSTMELMDELTKRGIYINYKTSAA